MKLYIRWRDFLNHLAELMKMIWLKYLKWNRWDAMRVSKVAGVAYWLRCRGTCRPIMSVLLWGATASGPAGTRRQGQHQLSPTVWAERVMFISSFHFASTLTFEIFGHMIWNQNVSNVFFKLRAQNLYPPPRTCSTRCNSRKPNNNHNNFLI